jgi:RNA polymerase sigma-70 factor (ECF subfamily)
LPGILAVACRLVLLGECRLKVGDKQRRSAYEELLRRYLAGMRRLAWSYARDASEDLFQEIAMALWTALPKFRGDSSERTWVYRVAHNTAISFMASHRRYGKREQTGEDAPECTSITNPEREVIAQERRERLRTAVSQLPIADRQIMTLHLEGLAATEIEVVTGISAGAVATRLSRLRKKLAAEVCGESEGLS